MSGAQGSQPTYSERGGEGIEVTWGAGIYPDGGFCFEISECATCEVPGDSNGDGKSNIADVVYDGDANGDGTFNVADVFYLIEWHFGGGPGPVCGP